MAAVKCFFFAKNTHSIYHKNKNRRIFPNTHAHRTHNNKYSTHSKERYESTINQVQKYTMVRNEIFTVEWNIKRELIPRFFFHSFSLAQIKEYWRKKPIKFLTLNWNDYDSGSMIFSFNQIASFPFLFRVLWSMRIRKKKKKGN